MPLVEEEENLDTFTIVDSDAEWDNNAASEKSLPIDSETCGKRVVMNESNNDNEALPYK